MARRRLLLGFLVVSLVGALGCGPALAQGCGAEPFQAGAPEPDRRELWRHAGAGLGAFFATLVTDEVVVATAVTPGCALGLDSLRAVDLASGAERWRLAFADLPAGVGGSQPSGAGDLVFVSGLTFGTGAAGQDERTLTAIDAATGEQRWVWAASGQPIFEVVGLHAGQVIALVADQTSTLLALDAATGAERWSVAFEGYGTAGTIDATTGTVYVGGFAPGGVADGLFLAAFALGDGAARWRLDNDDATEFWLVAHGNGLAYVRETGENGTTVRAFDAASGAETWSLALPEAAAGASWSVAGNADLLFAVAGGVAAGSSVVAIDPVTGTERWSAAVDVPLGIASTTLGDGELVFRLPDVESGGFDRGVLALDRVSGAECWRVELPGLGGLLAAGDAVFVTNGEPGEGQALRALDVATGEELWNLGFPELATLYPLDLAGATLLLSGANDDEAALIAIATD